MTVAQDVLSHAPQTDLFLEVAFRRLLAQCLDTASDKSPPSDGHDWRESIIFHHLVFALGEQLEELRPMLSPVALKAYSESVADIRRQLKSLEKRPISPEAPANNSPVEICRAPPRESAESKAPLANAGDLALQERVQEALTDELAVLAASLKQNTLGMESRVQRRGQLLESTETALDKSFAGVKKGKQKASDIHKRRRLGLYMTILMLIGIVAGFVGMYMFIKLTSIAGYRHAVPAPSPRTWQPHGGEL